MLFAPKMCAVNKKPNFASYSIVLRLIIGTFAVQIVTVTKLIIFDTYMNWLTTNMAVLEIILFSVLRFQG